MKALLIVGPTGVGKTKFAFEIAKKLPSVLISADSVQVFTGTDIISGKDLPKHAKLESGRYVIGSSLLYGVDIVSPLDNFSVFNFLDIVEKAITFAFKENKIPIIVGGTRFYIEALTKNIDTLSIPPDPKLREKLKDFSVSKLQKVLSKTNRIRFEKMNNSDKNNPRRLVRAIEVLQAKSKKIIKPIFKENEVLTIGLKTDSEVLKERIKKRLLKRIKDGAIDEARALFGTYGELSDQIKNTNGYKQLFEYFNGIISLDEAIEHWKISEYQLAKEQLKWVAAKKNIHVFDTSNKGFEEEAIDIILQTFRTS